MSALLEEASKSPRLSLYVERWQHLLAEERQRRQRFYDETTPEQKAEFINGEVVLQSPARFERINTCKYLLKLLDTFVEHHQLGWVGHEKVLVCLTRNDYEPDLCFFGQEKAAQIRPGQTTYPAPDFIVEILSPATAERDRGVKMDDYAAHGVREYWLVDPDREVVEQYELAGDTYSLRAKQADGTLHSLTVPGFEIPVRAVFDRAENLAALRRLTADTPARQGD